MVSRTEKLELMNRLAQSVQSYVRRAVPTPVYGRVKDSIRFIVTQNRLTLYSSLYFIRALNDGRKAIVPKGKGFLVWYADPFDDPRIAIEYPRTRGRVVSLADVLTPQQMRNDRKAGKLVFAKRSSSTQPQRFIEKGVQQFRKEAPKELRKLVRGRTRALIGRGEKVTVNIKT